MRRIPFVIVVLSAVFCSPVEPDRGPTAPDPADAPRLAGITPGVDEVRIEVGARVEFQVVATSPRDLPLTITYLVDGAPRAIAPAFAFVPDAPGTYAVSAVVSDGELETVHAWTLTVEPANLPPGAVLAIEPGGGEAPLAARVRVAGTDPDGEVVRYRLEVLGPATLTLERAAPIDTVLVLALGHWQATAIVEDDRGATSTVSRAIDVVPPNLPPVPTLLVEPRAGTVPLEVLVDADGSDPDGEIASYLLVIDGELTVESASPIRRTVRFENPGEFPVVLSVTDDRGAEVRDSIMVSVSPRDPDPPPPPANSPPAVALLLTPLEGEAPLDVAARSTGTDQDGVVTAVRIDFDGDGEPDAAAMGAEIETTFRYETAGTYAVRATAVDDDGAVATAVVAVTVRPPSNLAPTGSLSLSVTSGDAPLSVLATAHGSDPDGTIVKWEIEANEGDGFLELDESLAASLVYQFDEAAYRPRLRLTDDRGASAVIVGPEVTVYRPIGDAVATVRGNDGFASTAIAPAVWSDGQDRWRLTVTVRDHGGEPLADVPLRMIPHRGSLSAPDGTPLGPGASVGSGGLHTGRRRRSDRNADDDAQHPHRGGSRHRVPAVRRNDRGRRRARPLARSRAPRGPQREYDRVGDREQSHDPAAERGRLPRRPDRDRSPGALEARRSRSGSSGGGPIHGAALHGRLDPARRAEVRLRCLAYGRRGRDPFRVRARARGPEQARRGLGRRTADRAAGNHRPQAGVAVLT